MLSFKISAQPKKSAALGTYYKSSNAKILFFIFE